MGRAGVPLDDWESHSGKECQWPLQGVPELPSASTPILLRLSAPSPISVPH